MGTQDLCSETVECAYCGRGGWDLNEFAEAFAHFAGGFAGECYGEDCFGWDVLVCYQPCYTVSYDACFTATRSGDDHNRSVFVLNGQFLLGGQ